MLSGDPVTNFAKCTVSTGYDASATSIALSSGEGAKLPAPATDGAFNVVWWNSTDYNDPSDDPNREIVRVTARSTDTLTVTRAQESTSATTKNTAGKTYKMALAVTKYQMDQRRPGFYVGSSSRDISAASGDQAITGVGFQPRAVILLGAKASAAQMSIGIDDATTHASIRDIGSDTYGVSGSFSLYAYVGVSDYYTGYVSAMGTDGFTITWAKTGSPTGTFTFYFLCLR